MTVNDALKTVDTLKPNQFSEEDKIKWLNELDSQIKAEIIDIRDGAEQVSFNGYGEDMEATLLASGPHEVLYLYWLQSRMDYYNRESMAYNNSIAQFEAEYDKFRNWYNRMHRVIGCTMRYF